MSYKDCSQWNEKKFVKYCQGELSTQQEAEFTAHLDLCTRCRKSANYAWEIILDSQLTDDNSRSERDQEDIDIERFLRSPRWQEEKEKIV
ncbi:MAG: zf-HC2 domain-containing protein, partial [Acidobacteriota bacterium]